jgi:hypothetical protein
VSRFSNTHWGIVVDARQVLVRYIMPVPPPPTHDNTGVVVSEVIRQARV